VLGADDVSRPKPAPDIYLHAVELLDVEAQATVAFEDSAPGVASARAAGLHVVAVGTEDGGRLGAHEGVSRSKIRWWSSDWGSTRQDRPGM